MSDIAYAPAAQQPESAPGSFPRRVVDTFIAPIALFQRFGARPPWVDVTVLSMVLMTGAMTMVPASVFEATFREAMARQGQAVPAGAEGMIGIQRVSTIVMSALGPWIGLVISAGVLTLLFSVLMGGSATFRQYVSVAAHAGLIGAVGMWAKLPIVAARENIQAGSAWPRWCPPPRPPAFCTSF